MKNSKLKLANLIILLFFSLYLKSQDGGKRMVWYNYGNQQKYSSEELKKLPRGLSLKISQIDTSKIEIPNFVNLSSSNDRKNSFAGLLINNTESTKEIFTQDGSLIMIMEAKDSTNNWKPIEFWMWSDCGNSFDNPLKLEQGKLVAFRIPIYEGEINTKMRLKLVGQDNLIFSKNFNGQISKNQLYEEIELGKEYFWNGDDIYLDNQKN